MSPPNLQMHARTRPLPISDHQPASNVLSLESCKDAPMNILEGIRSFFHVSEKDTPQTHLTVSQQSNVPSRPHPQGSMPSTRSESSTSSKPGVSSNRADPKRFVRNLLDNDDHMQQDPIEVFALAILVLSSASAWLRSCLQNIFGSVC